MNFNFFEKLHMVVFFCFIKLRLHLQLCSSRFFDTGKYNHPIGQSYVSNMTNPNEPIFPIRPSEPSCQYYLRFGTCKFGKILFLSNNFERLQLLTCTKCFSYRPNLQIQSSSCVQKYKSY